jgi:hypothetical protein
MLWDKSLVHIWALRAFLNDFLAAEVNMISWSPSRILRSWIFGLALFSGWSVAPVGAEDLKTGKVELQSAGPIAFGPNGVLFLGDPKAAKIYAIDTADKQSTPVAPVTVGELDTKLAALLGVKPADVVINDLAVNPASNRVYLSVSRGKGPAAIPVVFVLDGKEGGLKELALESVPYASIELGNPVAPGNKRQEAITGIKFVKNKIFVAGLSNEEFASTLRSIPYPFTGKVASSGIQIYHGAHGKFETAAPVRTFTPLDVNGKEEILAAYTCTPLVRIPVSELQDGAKVKGTTVAELGNRNRPLDIVTYTKETKPFALMANSARGVMKVSLEDIEKIDAIVERIQDKAGLKYDTLSDLKGVEHLDKLGETHAVLLVRSPKGLAIQTILLP